MTQHVRPHERSDRSLFDDELLYLVSAALVSGIAPSRIASKLGLEQVEVGRILQMAHRAGIIGLNFLPCSKLAEVLEQNSKGTTFHVVPDRFRQFPYGDAHVIGLDPVCITAAKIFRERIDKLIKTARDEPIRVGCSGGYSLAKLVEALASDLQGHEPRGADRLVFFSLNAAAPINNYHISSNHLVTRLSFLYSDGVALAKHFAAGSNGSRSLSDEYQKAVQNLSLVMCSGGSIDGSYLRDYVHDKDPNAVLPPDAAGDLAYVLLREDGQPALCDAKVAGYLAELQAALKYEDLRQYAKVGKLFVVLSEHRNVLWADKHDRRDRYRPHHVTKLPLALALMREKLASEIVLGQTLAENIVRELKLEVPLPNVDQLKEELEQAGQAGLHEEQEVA
jgi:hypothetical protein